MKLLKTGLPVLVLFLTARVFAQGMPIDSLDGRMHENFSAEMIASLRDALPIRYDDQRVWGLAIGDFTSDGKPDLAISLYDLGGGGGRVVTVHLLENVDGKRFRNMFQKKYTYVETPIEVGLVVEKYIVFVVQKSTADLWKQEGYTIYAGDVISLNDFETKKIDLPAGPGKMKPFGYEVFRSYETLMTTEKYFDMKTMQPILTSRYYTFPAYSRLRSVYPGYGKEMYDTTEQFIIKGAIHRKDDKDLSIDKALTAYDEEYIYFSIKVKDDQVWGGSEKMDANDRVSLWFDAWGGDNRYLTKNGKANVPNFRTNADSTIYNIVFSLPDVQSKSPRLTISSAGTLTDAQQEASKQIRGICERDTAGGLVTGYTLRVRIPFAFLGLESNPVGVYENHATENMFTDTLSLDKKQKNRRRTLEDYAEYPHLGFTAVVFDVDNPSLPDEVTEQATSDFRPNDPTSYGELILIPSAEFYGQVIPTYTTELTEGLIKAGY
jgi:hypothetical protein